jgi:hypothetical protein
MEIHEAAAKINAIWAHVARVERFRGYRPLTVASTGLIGLFAAFAQAWVLPIPIANVDAYLNIWLAVAATSIVLVGLELCGSYLRTSSRLERQLLLQAVRQFVPCLCAGALFTWIIADHHPDSIVLLPGLWAICFSLGIFASVPYVTPAVIWVALYYLLAGSLCLATGDGAAALHPWLMGGTFGLGQLLMAVILLLAEERRYVP